MPSFLPYKVLHFLGKTSVLIINFYQRPQAKSPKLTMTTNVDDSINVNVIAKGSWSFWRNLFDVKTERLLKAMFFIALETADSLATAW